MEILYLLIPISVILVSIGIGVFVWAVRSGQFDDLEGPAHRILMDEQDPAAAQASQPEEGAAQAQKNPPA